MSEPGAVFVEKKEPAPPRSSDSPLKRMVKTCFACRIMSGSALVAAGAFVYMAGRRAVKSSPTVGLGTITQLAFACGLFAMGMVILVDPVDNMTVKEGPSRK